MNLYLIVNAVLFFIGALGNLADLARHVPARPPPDRTRAVTVALQAVLGAWAVMLLLRGGA
ncbi:hypothetical protein [Paraburkholderia adhaesiva]|uniref:hypothetical protein n=1 Tax=Paraburkholderia adhaesiva TaxID=2883244 RepID=UPI001F1B5FDE|nr:hypothetical protein [Paraburkholderia adhaesiva]